MRIEPGTKVTLGGSVSSTYVLTDGSDPMFFITIVYSNVSPGLVTPPFKSTTFRPPRKSGSYTSMAVVTT